MATFWACRTTVNSEFNQKLDYISDPALDYIERFKEEIVKYSDPSRHKDFVPCGHEDRAMGHLLFILGNSVEVLIKPDAGNRKLYFVDCNDI
ncbi:MAG: hypothetical protein OXC46_04735 [Thaumarchaeota archaeon]|nr:hypothetical protein [Nitrososphaerota archaeon]